MLFQHLPPPPEQNHASVSRIKSKRDFRECGVFVLHRVLVFYAGCICGRFSRVAPLGPVRGVRDVRGWPAVILAAVKTLCLTQSSTSPSTVGSKSTWLSPQVCTIYSPGGPPGVPLPLCQADAAGACRRQLSARQSCKLLIININKPNN